MGSRNLASTLFRRELEHRFLLDGDSLKLNLFARQRSVLYSNFNVYLKSSLGVARRGTYTFKVPDSNSSVSICVESWPSSRLILSRSTTNPILARSFFNPWPPSLSCNSCIVPSNPLTSLLSPFTTSSHLCRWALIAELASLLRSRVSNCARHPWSVLRRS